MMNEKSSAADIETIAMTEKVITSSNTLRAPASNFFSQHRRRSKTYSGEEFAQHFPESSGVAGGGVSSGSGGGGGGGRSAMITSESTAGSLDTKLAKSGQDEEHPKDLPNIAHAPCHPLLANRRNEHLISQNRRSLLEKNIDFYIIRVFCFCNVD